MDADVKRREQRLLDDLAEMRDDDLPRRGMGLIVLDTAPGRRLPRPEDWELLERVGSFDTAEGNDRFILAPVEYDPAPGGRSCIRWWGDETRVERLQEWGDRASAYLRTTADRPDDEEIGPGYHGLFDALVRVARADAELADRLETTTVLDVAALPAERRQTLPAAYRSLGPQAVFRFTGVGCPEPFVEAAFRRLLTPPRKPRLAVDLVTKVVTFDGNSRTVPDIHANILHELLQARDRPINRADMRKRNTLLEPEEKLHLKVKWIRDNLKVPVLSGRGGYYLPEDCWS